MVRLHIGYTAALFHCQRNDEVFKYLLSTTCALKFFTEKFMFEKKLICLLNDALM